MSSFFNLDIFRCVSTAPLLGQAIGLGLVVGVVALTFFYVVYVIADLFNWLTLKAAEMDEQ